jgi:hypothetical protein
VFVVVLSVGAVCSGVAAKYTNSSKILDNLFSREDYDTPTIDTTSNDNDIVVSVGKHVYPVYVRVSIVATWQDSTSTQNVYWKTPIQGEDYTFEYDSTNWTLNEADGYYYYNKAVASGNQTIPLFKESISALSDPPTGYTLHVELLTETIQAIGNTDDTSSANAVMDAWKFQPVVKEGD